MKNSPTSRWTDLRDRRALERAPYERARLAYELARQVRELRESVGISQRELADRMGTTQSVVARLEAGGSKPSLSTLERVAEAVGKQVEVRFRDRDMRPDRRWVGQPEPTVDLAQLAANLRLSPAERLSRATTFSRWVLRNRGRAKAAADRRARPG